MEATPEKTVTLENTLQNLYDHRGELEAIKERIASLENSLQSAKNTISVLEKDLHTSNARLGWFKYKLGETECKLEAAVLRTSDSEDAINGLNIEVELQKRETMWAEDEATDQGVDADFKIFRRLLLELYPAFDVGTFEARIMDEVINEAMDEVERQRVST